MTAPLLDVSDLRVSFGGKEVVHGVSFALAPGEKLALVGESGSGKTVTARSILGLLPETAQRSGAVIVSGKDVLSVSADTVMRDWRLAKAWLQREMRGEPA